MHFSRGGMRSSSATSGFDDPFLPIPLLRIPLGVLMPILVAGFPFPCPHPGEFGDFDPVISVKSCKNSIFFSKLGAKFYSK
jgi:hypothetical protein